MIASPGRWKNIACVVIRREKKESQFGPGWRRMWEKRERWRIFECMQKGKQREPFFYPCWAAVLLCDAIMWYWMAELTWGVYTRKTHLPALLRMHKRAHLRPPTNNRIIAHFHQFLICVFVCFHPSKLLLTWDWESPCGALRAEHTRQKLENIHKIL